MFRNENRTLEHTKESISPFYYYFIIFEKNNSKNMGLSQELQILSTLGPYLWKLCNDHFMLIFDYKNSVHQSIDICINEVIFAVLPDFFLSANNSALG